MGTFLKHWDKITATNNKQQQKIKDKKEKKSKNI
jgi:hypothetical protein